MVEFDTSTLEFNLPTNIGVNYASVLGFMLKVDSDDGMSVAVRLNGHPVWNWNWSEGVDDTRFYQEVVGGGVLVAGRNVLSFDSSGSYRVVEMSDVVLWWTESI